MSSGSKSPKTPTPEERERFRLAVNGRIGAADYRAAFKIVRRFHARYPRDFGVTQRYASVMGDYAEGLPPSRRARVKARSIAVMRALLQRSRGEPNRMAVFALRNEFYWQTKNRLAQYRLGASAVSRGNKFGYYCQGVGAAWHAYELTRAGRVARGALWARRAIRAWAAHRRFRPDYYNQYVHLGLAFGILERPGEMEAALRHGARLAGKEPSYREFEEIRELLRMLNSR